MSEHKEDNKSIKEFESNGSKRNSKGQFTEGNTEGGNKEGSLSITYLVRKALLEKPEGEDNKTYVQQFVKTMLDKAITKGDVVTQKMIWNYIDGLPRETKDINLNIPIPMMDVSKKNVLNNNSNPQDKSTE